MIDKIRRAFAIAALCAVVAVLGLLAYAIYKWAGSTFEYFGSTALLILGGCVVVAGLIVTPFGVSLHLGDKRSQAHARAYVANLAKVPEPAIAGPVYTVTQLPDPEDHADYEIGPAVYQDPRAYSNRQWAERVERTAKAIDDPDVEKRMWERNTIDTWIVWKDDNGLYACVPLNKLGQKMWWRALEERYEDSTPAWNRIRPLRKELGWIS